MTRRLRLAAARPAPTTLALAASLMLTGLAAHAQTATPPEPPASAPAANPAGEATLAPIQIRARADRTGTEGTGSYTSRATTTATRLTLSPRETPQSVSVLTRQQIDDQGIQSIEDIVNSVTGLSLSRGATERGSLQSRGFGISYYTADGLPMSASGDTLGFATLAMYDRVEVLRGASGMMNGAGNPSGTINLARKRASAEPRVTVTGAAGRWDNYRAEIDATGALNQEGTVRGRGVVAYQDSDTFIKNYSHQRKLVYGTVDADLGRSLEASVAISHNEEKNPGSSWYGLNTRRDGSFLPVRDLTNSPDWTYWNKTNTRLFGELVHKADNGWRTRLAGHVMKDQLDSLVHGTGRVGTTEQMQIISANIFTYDRYQRAVELTTGGPFDLLGQKHEAVFGVSYRTLKQQDGGYRDPAYNAPTNFRYVFDPVNWNPSLVPTPSVTEFYFGSVTESRQGAAFGTARFKLLDSLAFLAGARYDKFNQRSTNSFTNVRGTPYTVNEVTPYAGLVWDYATHWSAYASWTRVFNPQSAVDRTGELLPPVTGTNLEAGVKGEYFDGQLNLSAAVFEISQNNLAVSVPAQTPSLCLRSASCSDPAGQVKSQGFELQAAGRLTAAWQVSAGYTHNTRRYVIGTGTGTAATATGQPYAPERPNRELKLTTRYNIGDARVLGGLRAQNATYRVNSPIRQGGIAIADLGAGYRVNKNLDVQATVSNLFDKHYWQSIGTIDASNSLGEPRSFLVTARYTFE